MKDEKNREREEAHSTKRTKREQDFRICKTKKKCGARAMSCSCLSAHLPQLLFLPIRGRVPSFQTILTELDRNLVKFGRRRQRASFRSSRETMKSTTDKGDNGRGAGGPRETVRRLVRTIKSSCYRKEKRPVTQGAHTERKNQRESQTWNL